MNNELFFLNHLKCSDFNTIIHFGCGDGELLTECDYSMGSFYTSRAIFIDSSDDNLNKAKKKWKRNFSDRRYFHNLNELKKENLITPSLKNLVIFSNLHEMINEWNEIKEFLNDVKPIIVLTGMLPPPDNYSSSWENECLSKLKKNAWMNQLKSFTNEWFEKSFNKGYYIQHYLLKYSHVIDWQKEVLKDYFSTPWKEILKMGKNVYMNDFSPLKEQIKKDLDVDAIYPTHRQLIIDMKEMC